MFSVSETEAATIRTAFEQEGELSAGIELRRLFPGITDGAKAREMARMIAGWSTLPGATAASEPAQRALLTRKREVNETNPSGASRDVFE